MDLRQLGGKVRRSVDGTSALHLVSRENALSQASTHLHHSINRHIQGLQADQTKDSQFSANLDVLHMFLSQVDNGVHSEDPNVSSDEDQMRERLGQLKDLQSQFSAHQSELDTLNYAGYRYPLTEAQSQQLRELNVLWHKLNTALGEGIKSLQSQLLLHQNFSQKCEEWMVYLAQVEKDLTADVAGNYHAVLQQQQAAEVKLQCH